MRNKKSFSFNEEKDAEKLYNDGFQDGKIDYSKMYLVAKYIRQIFDYGEIRLEKEIIRYCKKQEVNFNPIKEAGYIKKWVKSALNYDLRKIESVSVSIKEIETLKQINSNRDRKLIFTMLIFSKALKKGSVKRDKSKLKTSENYYIHYNNFPDIIRLSRLNNITETDFADILHEHRECFTFYNAERELIRINFTDTNYDKEIIITDLSNVMDYYNIVFETHRPVDYCKRCGKEIKKNNNKQKYCKSCAKTIKTEQQKIIMRKRRALL